MLYQTKKAYVLATIIGAGAAITACVDQPTPTSPPSATQSPSLDQVPTTSTATPALIRQLAAGRGVIPLPPKPFVRPALSQLGQALTFDPILSGNRNISCSTCHLPAFATGDGKSLSVGEGGARFGPEREHPGGVFIPRNAPPLFNLGSMRHLFWDGRIEIDDRGVVHTPAGAQITPAMAKVFEFGPVSAIGMFPVTNRAEMRGRAGAEFVNNELGQIPDVDNPAIWSALMKRLGNIPEYRKMFEEAYPGRRFDEMSFAYASNAIGGFFVDQLTFTNSPWDRFLAGNDHALSPKQLDGAQTFLTLKCSLCHMGSTFSDEKFHDVAVAQLGPGEGDGTGLRDDFGRMRVTGRGDDRYLFRTTPLRNVELTGPYGHDGAIVSLRSFVEHYSDSDKKLMEFDPTQLESALRLTVLPTKLEILVQRDTLLKGVVLTPDLIDRLTTYMLALTDPQARNLTRIAPARLPGNRSLAARQ
ncbi:MAG: cytochrome c peroxidase [bacterium]